MMFILSFSIFFVCHAVILLIFCVITLWDSGAGHSPSGKELNPSSQEDARFSGRCTLAYNFHFILRHPYGTQRQLTHPPVKSSTLPLRKMPVFQGVAHRQTNFTLSCVIPLWDSATAHSPSGKELSPSSQEVVRFSGRCTLACNFHFILCHPSLGLSDSSLTLR